MATQLPETDKIKLAVVVGGHPYDVPGFRALFESIPDVDPYVQDVDNWARSEVWDQYDAFIFFNMIAWGTWSVRKDMDDRIKAAIERLGENGAGIFIWHHALLAFPEDETFDAVCNQGNRRLDGFEAKAELNQKVVDSNHPITEGIDDWTLVTEAFGMEAPWEGSHELITVDHPVSMPVLAWTHEYKKSRVFCYQVGHDAEIWNDPSFYKVLTRGIRWVTRRL